MCCPKIQKNGIARFVPSAAKLDVLLFNVTMVDAVTVQIADCINDLGEYLVNFLAIEVDVLDCLIQHWPRDKLRNEVFPFVATSIDIGVRIMKLCNVGMG